MTAKDAEISVVVVNYGTADLAIEAVESVLTRDHGGRSVEVHLVENASPGNDADRFRSAHEARNWGKRVILHLESENHGFGRGNNVALRAMAERATPPEKVFLLNPDARLDNEAISVLADFIENTPRAGVVGARITQPDGSPVTSAFRFPSLASEFQTATNFGPVSRALDRWTVARPPDLETQRVDWVAGAAVMFRFDALDAAGFFDPDYFLYYEEVDLIRRLARAGWEVWHVAQARVVHVEGAATQVRSHDTERRRRPGYWYDSRRMYFEKNYGRAYSLAAGLLMVAGGVAHHAISRVRRRPVRLPLHYVGDHVRLFVVPLLRSNR